MDYSHNIALGCVSFARTFHGGRFLDGAASANSSIHRVEQGLAAQRNNRAPMRTRILRESANPIRPAGI